MLDSVIVTFHQNGALLRLCLERLERAMPASAELIVVMNNADVRELAVPLPGRARVLEVPCNLGYAAAANLGAREARGRRLTFVDHDIVVAPGWFEALAELHESIAGPTLTGCKICDPQTLRVLDFGIGFTPFNAPHPHMDQPQHSALVAQNRQVQALCTAVCMIDRSTFEDLGGFDELFASLYTDIDLCMRLRARGGACWVSASAVAFHFGGEVSTLERAQRAHFLKADVKARFYGRHEPDIQIDMQRYYAASWQHQLERGMEPAPGFVAVSMMNVADPDWYLAVLGTFVNVMDTARLPSGVRDARAEALYPHLGYDFLKLRAPILYLLDRFPSVAENGLWWQERADMRDLIADRNGNIVTPEFIRT